MLKGFNCTIFAYGQTGTGKTYTMSGDISDHPLLPDDAGIIPRVLQFLFSQPNSAVNDAAQENSVKVSFIELYNEELRDLLSAEDKSNLKIFDGDSRRGAATIVHGMEEQFITSAKKGIQLLSNGSHRRQVAATKCNDLSSRSHTIFTITVYTKQIVDSGEELVCSGKLNLVDLAGSENIRRSGAENKRAVEAGLINKSLLTLGRVINALVDRSAHIPYRESRLTRLLQDSLGGRTKTCIIATVSPTRLNLEETISTLDYAFRAKNIRNKPQMNKLVPKKTLLQEFTVEIEKLKLELTASRQRNGVYLVPEAYEELLNEAESRKTLVKEQRDKIETIEGKLARKDQDLLELTSKFDLLKKDSESTMVSLNSTKSLLETTNDALADTRRMLNHEIHIRQQYELTEQRLTSLNRELLSTLSKSTGDVQNLHTALERQSKLRERNEDQFGETQRDVMESTTVIESRLAELLTEQQSFVDALTGRMGEFLKCELDRLKTAGTDLEEKSTTFETLQTEMSAQTTQSQKELKKELDRVLKLEEEVKEKHEAGLNDLGKALSRVVEDIMAEIQTFNTHLQFSYSNLSANFRKVFDDLSKDFSEQREQTHWLQNEMAEANRQLEESQSRSVNTISELVEKERTVSSQENKDLVERIQKLLEANMQRQELRIGAIADVSLQLRCAQQSHSAASVSFIDGKKKLAEQSSGFSSKLKKSCDTLETHIQDDYVVSNLMNQSVQIALTQIRPHKSRRRPLKRRLLAYTKKPLGQSRSEFNSYMRIAEL